MNRKTLELELGNAICYSGYREGQSPIEGIYPTFEQIRQDLRILQENWRFIRLYDCSPHAYAVLDVIRSDALALKVMLGADMRAEVSNPNCPWDGGRHSDETLAANRQANSDEIDRLIELAKRYSDIVFSVAVGNEATVEWTDHLVPVESLIGYVHKVKQSIPQPVTFCENYAPWTSKLEALASELDFISLHTYPVWEYLTIDGALQYTEQNYYSVADHYPEKPVVITEAGWTTNSNGRGIETWNASQAFQADYYGQLIDWSRQEGVLTFVFEAFDEPWKGSPDPEEPEKHWGVFTVDRKPKLVMQELYAHLRQR